MNKGLLLGATLHTFTMETTLGISIQTIERTEIPTVSHNQEVSNLSKVKDTP